MVDGVDRILDEWCDALLEEVELSTYTKGRLAELRQAAADFRLKGRGLSEWLSEVVTWKQREVTRKGVVQIMTVHKSKGLGFDTVILPYLDGSAFDSEGRMDVLDTDIGSDLNHILMAPVKDIRSADPVLKAEVEKWSVEQCYEQFCVLYVMLTRSVHGTYCLLDGKKNKPEKRLRNEADWIRESVFGCVERDEAIGEFAGRLIYEHGSWDWLDVLPVVEDGKMEQLPKPKLAPVERRKQNKVVSGEQSISFSNVMMDRGGLEYGDLVHQCFESIEWWQGKLAWKKDANVRKLVLECLENSSIQALFTAQEGIKVYREQAIESMIDGAWVSGVIDRLILDYDADGKVIHAAIVDFKTDTVEDPSELVERYSKQLETYRKMICKAYSLGEESVYALIISTHFKKIINL